MAKTSFSVTWDYLCPFARNAHEHLLDGLEAGAPWEVTFTPFSLLQAHVAEGEPAVWDQAQYAKGVLALLAGIVVRDRFPDRFPATHRALFARAPRRGTEPERRGGHPRRPRRDPGVRRRGLRRDRERLADEGAALRP